MSVSASVKADVPIQLLSTTNEALKSSSIQQQIPTKLAISSGKEKNKSKNIHHRNNSAGDTHAHTHTHSMLYRQNGREDCGIEEEGMWNGNMMVPETEP